MPEILEQIKALSRPQQFALLREIALLLEGASDASLSSEAESELILRAEQAYAHDGIKGDEWSTIRTRILASSSVQEEPVAA
jgi:hypothetical protein